jgi:hypothetical protein
VNWKGCGRKRSEFCLGGLTQAVSAVGQWAKRSVSGHLQDVPGGKVNILGGHSSGHSKQNSVYVHVSYSERFPR